MNAAPQAVGKKECDASNLQSVEYVRNVFRTVPPQGHSLDDVLAPNYFAHLAPKLKIGDRIEVLPETMEYFAELLVVRSERFTVHTALVNRVELATPEMPVTELEGHTVQWKGPNRKWSILRGDAIIKDSFTSRGDAQAALLDLLKRVA